ncbi:MAG: 2-isopropylmalate synthase [Candidatus Firestonebacteria bacterium]|nr:2-isopropylmalate synthase [Candidatus Firestonebacteria bacterium]
MSEKVIFFDTTLRDGEQSPGASLNIEEKLKIARQLAKLKVDIIEAGFPIASPGDFEAVKLIAREIKGPVICGLARATQKDIDRAWEALQEAEKPRIHTFIATSDIHLKHKLKMSRDEVLKAAYEAVIYAKNFLNDVEFSAEDASRSDPYFLHEVIKTAISAGATTINIPDTVGYITPDEFGEIIYNIKQKVKDIDQVVLSVHCHNDLGLAVANSISAVKNGARQVECTINGLGERAGNASLEEIAMILETRKNYYNLEIGIKVDEIYHTSRMVSNLTGIIVQPNKAIVGANAFAHEAGIHQDGILKERTTYEIMSAETIGLDRNRLVLGKHSGRHALKTRLNELGYELKEEELEKFFNNFKELADKKKEIFDEDLLSIINIIEGVKTITETYKLISLEVSCGTKGKPTAKVTLDVDGKNISFEGKGDGPVDAVYHAIAKITGTKSKLQAYIVKAITGGTDAQGDVTVELEENNRTVFGRGVDTDIIVASARAYINALNKLKREKLWE